MPQWTLQFQASPDKTSLTISMHEAERPVRSFVATAAEVEELIQTLAGFRQNMTPEVSRTLPDGQISGEVDPLVTVPTHPAAPDKLLVIRHHGIGWLAFLLPAPSARSLGRILLQGAPQISVPPDQTGHRH